VQASSQGVAQALAYLQRLEQDSGASPNMGAALEDAYAMMAASREAGASSSCNPLLVMLSSGINAVNTPNALEVVEDTPVPAPVVIFVLDPDNGNVPVKTARELSCVTGGYTLDASTMTTYQVPARLLCSRRLLHAWGLRICWLEA